MSLTKTNGITLDFDNWLSERSGKEQDWDSNWRRDIDGLRYLDWRCNFTGFMMSPIGTYRGYSFNAITKTVDDLDDFILHCENSAGERHIFLYDLHYNIGMPEYFEQDHSLDYVDPKFFDKPVEHQTTGWKIRFGQV